MPQSLASGYLIESALYLEGVYEKEEIQDLFKLFDFFSINMAGSIAIDIGANIGNHSIEFSRRFKKVLAFEPNPNTFKLLEYNTAHLDNLLAYSFGLSNDDEFLSMSENLTNYGASSTVYLQNDNKTLQIQVKTLDKILPDLENVKLIKIDVEGMEDRVLLGAKETIIRNMPIIAFEQNLSDFDNPTNETKSIKILRDLGYEVFWRKIPSRNKHWFLRALSFFCDVFFMGSVTRTVVTDITVPPNTYSLLIAVPKVNLSN